MRRDPGGGLAVGLAFVSGVCGLSYELLYSRLLTTYVGDVVAVSAAILATFLCGIGLGSILARRFARWLWLAEVGIGLYALAMALLFRAQGDSILRGIAIAAGHGVGTVAVVIASLAVPSTLVGLSVPLFALIVEQRRHANSGFSVAYGVYNLGAGCSVLGLDALASRIGVTDALLAMATLNLLVGLTLKLSAIGDDVPLEAESDASVADASIRRRRLALLGALAVASVLSGMFQIAALRVVCFVLGPFHQCFALLLFATLLGLSTGTWLSWRWQLCTATALLLGGLLCLFGAALLPDAVDFWTFLASTAGQSGAGTLLGRAAFACVLVLPGATAFGSLIPALVAEMPGDGKLAGHALGVSSFANCVGYLAAVLILLSALPLRLHFVAAGAGLSLLGLALTRSRRSLVAAVAGVALVALVLVRWPREYETFAYTDFESPASLAEAKRKYLGAEVIRRLNSQLSLVKTETGAVVFNVNGYTSLLVSAKGQVNPRELVVGMLPAVYSRGHADALVLGTGTGITAGTTATLYDRETVVEIDPAVAAALPRFDAYNFGLARRKNVRLLREDGLTTLARSNQTYDAIVSTVTSPMYFASAKLYTTDFFRLAREHLRPGGVYVLWLDARITPEGSAVVLETLARSFEKCHFAFLTADYFAAICGSRDLSANPSRSWPPEVERTLTRMVPGPGAGAILGSLLFAPKDWRPGAFHDDENTFDVPVLERLMLETVADRGAWLLPRLIGIDVHGFAPGVSPPDAGTLAARCYVLVTFGANANPLGCANAMVSENGGELPLEFVELAAKAADSTGRPVVPEPYLARAYLKAGDAARSASRLARGPESCGDAMDCRCLHASLSLRIRGRGVSDAELSSLATRAPLFPCVRRVLLDASLRRGHVDDARTHLSLLEQLEPLSPAEQFLAARLGVGEAPQPAP